MYRYQMKTAKEIKFKMHDIDIDIDAPDKKGHTPLLTAAFSGSIEAFQFLMISGANIEATGFYIVTV